MLSLLSRLSESNVVATSQPGPVRSWNKGAMRAAEGEGDADTEPGIDFPLANPETLLFFENPYVWSRSTKIDGTNTAESKWKFRTNRR